MKQDRAGSGVLNVLTKHLPRKATLRAFLVAKLIVRQTWNFGLDLRRRNVQPSPAPACLAKGVAIERWDCLRSTKGGKRGESSSGGGVYDINPCFCPFDAYCKNMTSGEKSQSGAGQTLSGCKQARTYEEYTYPVGGLRSFALKPL